MGESLTHRGPSSRDRERWEIALWSLTGATALFAMLLALLLTGTDVALVTVAQRLPIPAFLTAPTLLLVASYVGGRLERQLERGGAGAVVRTVEIVLLNMSVATLVVTLVDRYASGSRALLADLLGPSLVLVGLLAVLLVLGVAARMVHAIGLLITAAAAALLVTRADVALSALAGLALVGYLVWSVVDEIELRLRRGRSRWTPVRLVVATFDVALRGPERLLQKVLTYFERG